MSTMLVDLNQVVITGLTQHLTRAEQHKKFENPDVPIEQIREGLIRHISLNTLRSNIVRFKTEYPNIVMCFDAKQYWRKQFFPFYKVHRKADREASAFDWHLIFETINNLKTELKENFPYKVMCVEQAEADDIIATLTKDLHKNGPVLILSADKDFTQLQKYPNVKQFSPMQDLFVKTDDPITYYKEHVIRGDRGDGIPNILSPDNCFVIGERQKSINKAKAEEWIRTYDTAFINDPVLSQRFKRNQTLIDFDYIPEDIQTNILSEYENTEVASRSKILNYLISKKLNNLIEHVSDF